MTLSSEKPFFLSRMLVVLLSVISTSCLTFEETISFNQDGSGSMKYIMDMSEIAQMLKMAQAMDTTEASSSLSFDDKALVLGTVPGISNIQSQDDQDAAIYGVSFDFKDVSALNKALNILVPYDENIADHEYYKMDKKAVHLSHLIVSAPPPGLGGGDEADQKIMEMLEMVKYKINMEFAQPVSAVYTIGETELYGKKRNKVLVESTIKEVMEDSKSLDISVVLN